jgi:triacylglycerol lipase
VREAYRQLAAFQENNVWALPEGYGLLAKLQGQKGLPIGFIASSKADIFLVFRGTMTPLELLRDFRINLSSYPYAALGKVHDGFIRVYDEFRTPILDCLKRIGRGKRLYIAGHSLGAALATLAAPDISSSTVFKSPAVYTYGSPRVGDRAFADGYNRISRGCSYRIANTCDLVVSLPFPVPFLNFIGGFFTHVDEPVEFTAQEEDVEKNHDIGTYLASLEAAAGQGGFFRNVFKPSR